ncbi:hypothetical protein BMG00_16745 [Thioclava marina]|uniref:Uncharacterized protein n=1 Tax=Thioclava marina TaxID=1915077 RepID=A0ABX3MII1_9RHOB|nr:hypothetical protein [Thioclava marina]OOY11367.1 hypothetical protein BMG00_16745 [Thioclava marina]
MSSARSLLTRVARLEAARAPKLSRIAKAYGSFDAFAEQVRRDMEAGVLDRDFPLPHLERWEREKLC